MVGLAKTSPRNVEVLWCGSSPKSGKDGWRFPVAVEKLLIRECAGLSVLHLFGGHARFGTRMDIDPSTRPDVIADAWMPPFARDSFDVVIVDPPYVGGFADMNCYKVRDLLCGPAWIARRRVIWFHTVWTENPVRMKMDKAWLVRVGRSCAVRCLQIFNVAENKLPPVKQFRRGPAIKYNRWLSNPHSLPFGVLQSDQQHEPVRGGTR